MDLLELKHVGLSWLSLAHDRMLASAGLVLGDFFCMSAPGPVSVSATVRAGARGDRGGRSAGVLPAAVDERPGCPKAPLAVFILFCQCSVIGGRCLAVP